MALSTGSTILVNDISTALNGKIDTAGTGLSKSGTTLALATVTTSGGTAGPTANATPSYGSTFTVPKVVYDKYGRVTGHTNYTVKIPAAPSSVSTATPNIHFAARVQPGTVYTTGGTLTTPEGVGGAVYTFPAGGTWRYFSINSSFGTVRTGTVSGGSTANVGIYVEFFIIAVRIS